MNEKEKQESWLWKINRHAARFIHEPNEETEQKLVDLIYDYRELMLNNNHESIEKMLMENT